MLSPREVLSDIDLLSRGHRDALSPEARARYDREERLEYIKADIVMAGTLLVVPAITILPWVVGVVYICSGALSLASRTLR